MILTLPKLLSQLFVAYATDNWLSNFFAGRGEKISGGCVKLP